MNRLQRFGASLSVFAFALGGALAATASPAMAAPTNCPNSSMCGYVNSGFATNQGYEISPVRTNGTCENVAFNDAWSSIHNGSGKTVRFFAQANCAGSGSFTMANGSSKQQLGISNPTFENEISSYRWGG